VYAVIVTLLLFLSVLGNFVLFTITLAASGGKARFATHHRPGFEEQFVEGDTDARNKIAVIYLTGVISSSSDGFPAEDGMVGSIQSQLKQALEDDHVKAIVLRINSPGGEVVASDTIYQAVRDASDKKPVVASIDSVGASGAYYAAVGADYIIATDVSITGSIGVILQTLTFGDLMGKIGVRSHTFKSGRYKDVLNPMREPTEDEKQLVQTLITEVYEKFVGIVAEERHVDLAKLKSDSGMADGRILSGTQAKAAGLVDATGNFEDALEKAKELAHIRNAKAVRYLRPFSFRDIARIFGKSDRPEIQIEITPRQLRLETGKLYYLPAYMFQ